MKKIKFLLFFILFSSQLWAISILKGNIKHWNNSNLYINTLVDDYFTNLNIGREKIISVNSNGDFNQEINNTSACVYKLSIDNKLIYVYIQTSDTVVLNFDQLKLQNNQIADNLNFLGINAEGNFLFNIFDKAQDSLEQRFKKNIDSLGYIKNLDPFFLKKAISILVEPFDKLYENDKITTHFYNLVVKAYIAQFLTREIRLIISVPNNMSFEDKLLLGNQVYAEVPVSEDMIKFTQYGNMIGTYYYKFIEWKNNFGKKATDSVININGEKLYINRNFTCWLFSPSGLREHLWAYNLITLKTLFPQNYSEKDKSAFLSITQNNKIKDLLLPFDFNYGYNNRIEKNQDDFVFLENVSNQTLNEIIKFNFKEKFVFVDFWASWCIPCREEFPKTITLFPFFKENDIEVLFVSLNKVSVNDTSNTDAYRFNLQGNHILASAILMKDLRENYSIDNDFPIPRYMVFDKVGNPVNLNFLRPLDPEFITEFKKLLGN